MDTIYPIQRQKNILHLPKISDIIYERIPKGGIVLRIFKAIWGLVLRAFTKLAGDNISAYAAQAAFFLLTSMFPFIMLLLSLLQFFPFDMEDLINAASNVLPAAVEQFIVPVITEIYEKGTPTLISVVAITALWSASAGVNAVVNGLSKIFDEDKADSWLKIRLESIFFMLGLIIVIILSLGVSVYGNIFSERIMAMLPHLRAYELLSLGIKFFCVLCILTLIFDLIYLFAPSRKSTFSAQLPGALVSAVGWVGFSVLYSFYLNNLANFSLYGSLAAVVFFMLWMYICLFILFVGAEINTFVKRHRIRRGAKELIDRLKES